MKRRIIYIHRNAKLMRSKLVVSKIILHQCITYDAGCLRLQSAIRVVQNFGARVLQTNNQIIERQVRPRCRCGHTLRAHAKRGEAFDHTACGSKKWFIFTSIPSTEGILQVVIDLTYSSYISRSLPYHAQAINFNKATTIFIDAIRSYICLHFH